VFVGYDREEVVFLSNGESMSRKGGFHEGWEPTDDDDGSSRKWGTPGRITDSRPGYRPPTDNRPPIDDRPSPDTGPFASWTPFNGQDLSQNINQGRSKILYLANNSIIVDPSQEQLMDVGMIPDTRPEPLLTMLPTFSEQQLTKGQSEEPEDFSEETLSDLPAFEQPSAPIGDSKPHEIWGYEFDLLSGYTVLEPVFDPETNVTRVDVVREDDPGSYRIPAMSFGLYPQQFVTGTAHRHGLVYFASDFIEQHGAAYADEQYGLINGEFFVRHSRHPRVRQTVDTKIYYVAHMRDAPSRIAMSISSSMQKREQILACEKMARSLRRIEITDLDKIRVPDLDAIDSALIQNSSDESQKQRVKVYGPFVDEKTRASRPVLFRDRGDSGFAFSCGSSMFVDLLPMPDGIEPEHLLFSDGKAISIDGKALDPRYTLHTFGRPVTYHRLWNNEVFARVDHGELLTRVGDKPAGLVSYYGLIGDYWTRIRLIHTEDDLRDKLAVLEEMLLGTRLATVDEFIDKHRYEDWLVRIMTDEKDHPLTLHNGVNLKTVRDAEIPGLDNPPSENDAPDGLEPVEGYEQWQAHEEVEQYLGGSESFGRFAFKPLKDLRASAKNDERYAEYFARTDAGKVGLSLKF
ncbi:MAG TPA: hypothetical protein VLA12_22200, partial [Planctomycetaceae bacterium]|nr:hypothetical protein [Planctomycetaceae bacterium]